MSTKKRSANKSDGIRSALETLLKAQEKEREQLRAALRGVETLLKALISRYQLDLTA